MKQTMDLKIQEKLKELEQQMRKKADEKIAKEF